MRILLDACVPRSLRDSLSGHEVRTAPEMGWGDLDSGDLLDAIAGHFDALVTVDKRLPDQQRISDRPFGVVVLPKASFIRALRAPPARGRASALVVTQRRAALSRR
jgi:hypothetical protein